MMYAQLVYGYGRKEDLLIGLSTSGNSKNVLNAVDYANKNGAITVSNHVFMWDYLCVLKAIRPHLQYHPGWKTNFEGPNAFFITDNLTLQSSTTS